MDDFVVTDRAKEAVAKYLKHNDSEYCYVRVGVRGGGCSGMSYVLEVAEMPQKDDHVIQADERNAILVDAKSFIFLKGTVLDYKSGLMDAGFKFDNPKEKSKCGCGESFSV